MNVLAGQVRSGVMRARHRDQPKPQMPTGDMTPLYVAISEADYEIMIEQALGQAVIRERLTEPTPFLVFDPKAEEIVKWIPPL
ncbi:MAG: hypothetical protein OXG78_07005 [Chloroflexi bacterium]|nr:hypothetical protein [Chloroflexota bacterium]